MGLLKCELHKNDVVKVHGRTIHRERQTASSFREKECDDTLYSQIIMGNTDPNLVVYL